MKEVYIKLVLEDDDKYEELKDIVNYISEKLHNVETTGSDFDKDKIVAIINGTVSNFVNTMATWRKMTKLDYLLQVRHNSKENVFEVSLTNRKDFKNILYKKDVDSLIKRDTNDAITLLSRRIVSSLKGWTSNFLGENENILYKDAVQLLKFMEGL